MRSLALAVAALMLLASCSDDPEPIEPTATASEQPTSAPAMPDAAREDTPSGAATFVSYWVEVSNFASQTGDTEELTRISDKNCKGCETYIDLYEKTYAAGGYFRGSEWRLSEVQVEPRGNEHLVFAHVDAPVGTFKTAKNSEVQRGNEENSDLVFGVSYVDDSWRLTQLGLKSELGR
jgi:hypothetical protein